MARNSKNALFYANVLITFEKRFITWNWCNILVFGLILNHFLCRLTNRHLFLCPKVIAIDFGRILDFDFDFSKVLCCLLVHRFKKGLNIDPFNIVDVLERNKDSMHELFVHTGDVQVTYEQVLNLFQVLYSSRGSNQRVKEAETYTLFKDWLMDLDGM